MTKENIWKDVFINTYTDIKDLLIEVQRTPIPGQGIIKEIQVV